MRYEINADNAVLIFIEPQEAPVLLQPYDPAGDGKPFKSKAAAEKWATEWVAAREAELAEAAPAPIES